MSMDSQAAAKVFYTPVKNPSEVKEIDVSSKDLENIRSTVQRIIRRKIRELRNELDFKLEELKNLMTNRLNEISQDYVKELFRKFSEHMYSRAREMNKYLCLIKTDDFIFIYHFTPKNVISFERGKVEEFINSLDDSILNRFIIRLNRNVAADYFKEELSGHQQDEYVYGIFDKNNTKGFRELIGIEPDYEYKGELRIRIERTDRTDVVVETYLEDLKNIRDTINFDFNNEHATVNIENAPIKEIRVDGKPYDVRTGMKRIDFETLGIGRFMSKYKSSEGIKETKDKVYIGNEQLEKPNQGFIDNEESIFILGKDMSDYTELVNYASEAIKNNFNVGFVELNSFSRYYDTIKIGDFRIFARVKEGAKKCEDYFGKIIESVSNNLTLKRTIYYVALIALCKFLRSTPFREKLYSIAKKALNDYYMNMPDRNIELKEIDELGIEFKAGIRNDGHGFFDSSPDTFCKKLLDKLNKKKIDTVIFFVGINEDTRDFSPIPLDRIRNEFHGKLKECLSKSCAVLLSETVPISQDDGILIIGLQKKST
jgi:hypothetical protein